MTLLEVRQQIEAAKEYQPDWPEGLRMLKESGRWDEIIADGLAGKYDAKEE